MKGRHDLRGRTTTTASPTPPPLLAQNPLPRSLAELGIPVGGVLAQRGILTDPAFYLANQTTWAISTAFTDYIVFGQRAGKPDPTSRRTDIELNSVGGLRMS